MVQTPGFVDTLAHARMMKVTDAGWSSPVARRAHNPKVAGSNPAPATIQTSRGLLQLEEALNVSSQFRHDALCSGLKDNRFQKIAEKGSGAVHVAAENAREVFQLSFDNLPEVEGRNLIPRRSFQSSTEPANAGLNFFKHLSSDFADQA